MVGYFWFQLFHWRISSRLQQVQKRAHHEQMRAGLFLRPVFEAMPRYCFRQNARLHQPRQLQVYKELRSERVHSPKRRAQISPVCVFSLRECDTQLELLQDHARQWESDNVRDLLRPELGRKWKILKHPRDFDHNRHSFVFNRARLFAFYLRPVSNSSKFAR